MSFQKFYINGNDNEFWIETAEEESVFKPFNSTIKLFLINHPSDHIRSSIDFDLNNKNQSIKSILGRGCFDEGDPDTTSINIFGNEIFNLFPKISFLQANNSDQYNTSSLVVKRQKKGDKYGPPDCCVHIFLDDETFKKIDDTIKNKIKYNIEFEIDFSNYEGIYLKNIDSNSKLIKYCILEKFEDIENYPKFENLRKYFKTNLSCNKKEDNIIKLVNLKISYNEKNYENNFLDKLDKIETSIQQLSNQIYNLNQTIIDKEISSKD